MDDRDAGLKRTFPEYEALGISLDFSAEGYKARLRRIWELAAEGRGPVIEMRKLFTGSRD
jgi:hypothetical protein